MTSSSILVAAGLLAGATLLMAAPNENDAAEAARVEALSARFASVDLTADISGLPSNERQALARMIEAARIMDALFVRQVSPANESLLLRLVDDASPLGRARLHYFMINKGPWDRLDHDAPFIPGVGPKPPQANFYPAGATRGEVEAWIQGLPEPEKEAASGFFTTIRRGARGGLWRCPTASNIRGSCRAPRSS